jgi:hexosaminidase
MKGFSFVLIFPLLLLVTACATVDQEIEEEFVLRMETTRVPLTSKELSLSNTQRMPEASQLVLLPQPRSLKLTTGFNMQVDPVPAVRFSPSTLKAQGYALLISETGISITAADEAGLFYARQTLAQLQRFYEGTGRLPCLLIEDWPDYPNRGVLLDIARDKIPTMESLYAYVDLLAQLKFNQLQLYMEHSFAYPNHEVVWRNASPMTPEEIRVLDRYCADRYIELVPNQNSFSHMERWLSHKEYEHLAEIPGKADLCATHPGSILLLKDMYNSLLPCFTSKQANVGCDETFSLGRGASREIVEARGKGVVYLDFLIQISELVRAHGKTMQFWGDIILEHPELIPQLPDNVIAMEWGYEANHPFDDRGTHFEQSGIPFYVCPGTSSWNSLLGRTDNAMMNLQKAAQSGLKHGAIGYLITDWGDGGHWQFPAVSYLPLARGASLSWAYDANLDQDLAKSADLYLFQDKTKLFSQALLDLGNAYQLTGALPHNAAPYYGWLLFSPEGKTREGFFSGVSVQGIERAAAALQDAYQRITQAQAQCYDSTLMKREIALSVRMALLSLSIGKARVENDCATSALPVARRKEYAAVLDSIMEEYALLWQARNRSGGLSDSLEKMGRLRHLLVGQ